MTETDLDPPGARPRPDAPYPGLRPFEKHEWPIFFGRETMVQDVVERLVTRRLVAIHGESGCGKSSLVRAGVLPLLESDQMRSGGTWRTVEFRPGDAPLTQLAEALAPLGGPEGDGLSFRHLLLRGETAPAKIATALKLSTIDNLCILFDQFEELFEHARRQGPVEASILTGFLVSLVNQPPPGLHVILTMRSDYMGRCAQWRGFAETINDTQYLVPRMEHPALWRAIREPAVLYGGSVAPRLAERLIADAGFGQDRLPLIQHGLMRMWHAATGGNPAAKGWHLDLEAYSTHGHLSDIVDKHAEACLGTSDPRLAEAVFGMLTDRSPDGEAIRRPQTLERLAAIAGSSPRQVADLLRPFRAAGASFVRPFGDSELASDSRIEISHESFIRAWKKIIDPDKGWLKRASDDGLRWRTLRLTAEDFARDRNNWLPERSLKEAEALLERRTAAWADQHGDGWGAVTRLVKKSRDEFKRDETGKARRRFVWAVAAASLFAALFVIAVVQTFRATRGSEIASRAATVAKWNETVALAALSKIAASEGQYADAIKLALAAWPRIGDEARPATKRTFDTLGAALVQTDERARWRHGGSVWTATFSPDGTRVVTASDDMTAQIWDAHTGQRLGPPMRHEGSVAMASFSLDGTRVLTASKDKTARLWDGYTGAPIGHAMHHDDNVNSAAFSPDGTRLLTASNDKTARLWDARTGAPLGTLFRHENAVLSVTFSPDGTRALTASADMTARIWDARTLDPMGAPMRHNGRVGAASFSRDSKLIVTAAEDNEARLWDAYTGEPAGPPFRHEGNVWSAAFSPDGTRVVTASADNTARLWETRTGKHVAAPMHHEKGVWSASFSPNGTRVVTSSVDGTVRFWDADTGEPMGAPKRHGGTVWSAAFSPDGTRVVTASFDSTARLFSVNTGETLGAVMRSMSVIRSIALSPDGRSVVTASDDAITRIWDAHTGQQLLEIRPQSAVTLAAFSPDGTRLVTVTTDNSARVWEARTGEPVSVPISHDGAINSVTFSPDGNSLITTSDDKTARRWDARTGTMLGLPMRHESAVRSAAFSPDSRLVVTASDDAKARLWDVHTGLPLGEPLNHSGPVASALFAPNGIHLVTASADGTARLWDAHTGQALGVPMRHMGPVASVAFSPNGKQVVTGSDDSTARLWDARTGEPMGTPMNHSGPVASVAFSRDGTRVLTASADNTTRIWDAHTGGVLLRFERSGIRVAFSPNAMSLVTAAEDGNARIWDISHLEKGNAFEVACQRLGNNTDLSDVIAKYGLRALRPICGANAPLLPDLSKLE